ncbi:DKNYY domain-containing protein [Pseudoalteromonas sp. SMS1]|uniref:DKNYY domain-containing protein n=1 Tax=Pseudoalteromonas sp. SMS1 TaxID=2908894 RepID=UPI001F2BFC72|nr:DKNYY domain-containing protein [Pseudoalteromonas sp. SMS1]MCF2856706.1 DKNYY domain-containing protein [Pseudoalteromonas sp. SMS1]
MKKAIMALGYLLLLNGCASVVGNFRLNPDIQKVSYNVSYSHYQPANYVEMKNVDFSTFTYLNDNYAKDKNYVYHWGAAIPFADPASFTIVTGPFAYDKQHVFRFGDIVPGLSPTNLTLLEVNDEPFGATYLRSNSQIWFNGIAQFQPFTPCDIDTFKVITRNTSYHAKDSQCVYYEGKVIDGADPRTFKVKYDSHGVDKNNVYFKHHVLPDLNAAKLKRMSLHIVKDQNSVYYKDKKLDADISTFQKNGSYFNDKNHVYFDGQIVQGADPETFKGRSGLYFGRDKNGCYSKHEPVSCDTKPTSPLLSLLSYTKDVDLDDMTTQEGKANAFSQIFKNIAKENKASKEKWQKGFASLVETKKSELNHAYLTPENADKIDLSKLPQDYHFDIFKPGPGSRTLSYHFKGIESEQAIFAIFNRSTKGVMLEKRTLSGQPIVTNQPIGKSFITFKYLPFECTTQLGICSHTLAEIDGESTEQKVSQFNISYQDGLWTRSLKEGDKKDIFLFDEFGMPVIHATFLEDKLHTLWFRKVKG